MVEILAQNLFKVYKAISQLPAVYKMVVFILKNNNSKMPVLENFFVVVSFEAPSG
jgi:hypothetical protein